MINSDDAYWFTWSLPAPDYFLFTSPSLDPGADWIQVELPAAQIGSQMGLFLQGEELPSIERSYFRLQVVEPVE